MEQVKQYFNSYPESNECHETADGFLFHEKQSAAAHAGTLGNKAVKTHRRDGLSSIPGEGEQLVNKLQDAFLKVLSGTSVSDKAPENVASAQEMVDVVVTPEMVQENPELPFAAGDVIQVTKEPKEEGESGTFTNAPAAPAAPAPVPPAAGESPAKPAKAKAAAPAKGKNAGK